MNHMPTSHQVQHDHDSGQQADKRHKSTTVTRVQETRVQETLTEAKDKKRTRSSVHGTFSACMSAAPHPGLAVSKCSHGKRQREQRQGGPLVPHRQSSRDPVGQQNHPPVQDPTCAESQHLTHARTKIAHKTGARNYKIGVTRGARRLPPGGVV